MKKRIFNPNYSTGVSQHLRTDDDVLRTLPVDQFNVQDFNMNRFGWPKSDLTQLVELTNKSEFNESRFQAFAARIHMLKAEPRNNKSVEQLINEWRPAWIQTVTEEMRFREYYYDTFEKSLEKADDKPDTDNVVETSNPSADE